MITDNLQVGGACLVAGLVIGGYLGWHFTAEYKDAKHEVAMADIQHAADAKMLELQQKHAKADALDKQLGTTLQRDYDEKLAEYQKKLVRAEQSANTWRLRVNVPTASCGAASNGASGAGTTETVSVDAGVPDTFRSAVLALTKEADELRLWGQYCHVSVNTPSCVCVR